MSAGGMKEAVTELSWLVAQSEDWIIVSGGAWLSLSLPEGSRIRVVQSQFLLDFLNVTVFPYYP